MNFVLGGIKAPKSARNANDKAEPFGQEAHDLASKRLSQRDVEINVIDIDKMGGFIGEIFINKELFAKILVEEGYASVHPYSAEKSGNAAELLAAEQRAKEAKRGLWVSWDPSLDVPAEASEQPENDAAIHERKVDYRDVMITNIDEDGKLKLQ
jgi:staphylococcal nuclease domain-containing protein 1